MEDSVPLRHALFHSATWTHKSLYKLLFNFQTPLHLACQNGHLLVVEALLSAASVDVVNLQDRRGQTALHLSVETGNIDIVNVLLNRDGGANMNVKNNAGKSAFEQAMNHAAILDLMQRHSARKKMPGAEDEKS